MKMIKNWYWQDVIFNNSEVRVDYVSCKDKPSPWDDYDAMYKVSFHSTNTHCMNDMMACLSPK